MKRIVYPAVLGMIMIAGLFVWMVKGQETRHKWVAKMKNKHENKNILQHPEISEVTLDEIEMATYHS